MRAFVQGLLGSVLVLLLVGLGVMIGQQFLSRTETRGVPGPVRTVTVTASPEVRTVTEIETKTKAVTPAVCRQAIDLADDVIHALRKVGLALNSGNTSRATYFIGRANSLQDDYASTGQRCYRS